MANSFKVKRLIMIAFMSAIISVLSPFSITTPLSPVPITLTTFAIYLSIVLLRKIDAVFSVAIYMFMGLVGIPVFSGFTSGIARILGPTGGYIIGYVFLVLVAVCVKGREERNINVARQFLGMILGTIVLYLFGTVWLAKFMEISFLAALTMGVMPFILGDTIKIVLALFIGTKIKKVLLSSGLI